MHILNSFCDVPSTKLLTWWRASIRPRWWHLSSRLAALRRLHMLRRLTGRHHVPSLHLCHHLLIRSHLDLEVLDIPCAAKLSSILENL